MDGGNLRHGSAREAVVGSDQVPQVHVNATLEKPSVVSSDGRRGLPESFGRFYAFDRGLRAGRCVWEVMEVGKTESGDRGAQEAEESERILADPGPGRLIGDDPDAR